MGLLLNLAPSMRAVIDDWVPLLSSYVHTMHGRARARRVYLCLCVLCILVPVTQRTCTRWRTTLIRVHMGVEAVETQCCRAALTRERVMQGICAFPAQYGTNQRDAVGCVVQVGRARMLSGASDCFCLNTPHVCVFVCVCVCLV